MSRTRRVVVIAGLSLAAGVAAFALSFLSSSLAIPGPAQAATTESLRERGAARYMAFCGNTFEPRFWPECLGGADDWRTRGAERLVAFCIRHRPSRLFTGPDCESDDRAPAALTAPPGRDDAVIGLIATLVTCGVLVGLSEFRRVRAGPAQSASSGR